MRNGEVRKLLVSGDEMSVTRDVWALLHYMLENRSAVTSGEIRDNVLGRASMKSDQIAVLRGKVAEVLKRDGGFKLVSDGAGGQNTGYFIRQTSQ